MASRHGEARRGEIFNFIVEYKREHGGVSPTIREIQEHTGVTSTSSITHHLGELERQGAIYFVGTKYTPRNIAVTRLGMSWESKNNGITSAE